jgi:hypothetical protein
VPRQNLHAANEFPVFDSFPNDSQDDFFPEICRQRNQSAERKMITYKRWVLPGLLSLGPLISQNSEERLFATHRIVVSEQAFLQGDFGFDNRSSGVGMHFGEGEKNGSRKSH